MSRRNGNGGLIVGVIANAIIGVSSAPFAAFARRRFCVVIFALFYYRRFQSFARRPRYRRSLCQKEFLCNFPNSSLS